MRRISEIVIMPRMGDVNIYGCLIDADPVQLPDYPEIYLTRFAKMLKHMIEQYLINATVCKWPWKFFKITYHIRITIRNAINVDPSVLSIITATQV